MSTHVGMRRGVCPKCGRATVHSGRDLAVKTSTSNTIPMMKILATSTVWSITVILRTKTIWVGMMQNKTLVG